MKKKPYYVATISLILLLITLIYLRLIKNTTQSGKYIPSMGSFQFDNEQANKIPKIPKNRWSILSKDSEKINVPIQNIHVLFSLPLEVRNVVISPDSDWIIAQFPAEIQDALNDDIKVFDKDKQEWISLVPNGRHFGNGTTGSFSPNGKYVIVTSQHAPAIKYEIGDWARPQNLQNETLWPHSNFVWSPDSSLVIHTESEPGIAMLITDLFGNIRPILDYGDTGLDSKMDFSIWGPDWFPDSKRILYLDVDKTTYEQYLRIIDLKKHTNKLLAVGSLKADNPDLSYDGRIVMMQGNEKIYLYHPDLNYYDEINYNLPIMVSPHPIWGKDSKRLIINTNDGVYVYSLISNHLWKISEKDTIILQMEAKGCIADIFYNTEKDKNIIQMALNDKICTE
jgi:tricorn protease-like protein